MNNFLLRYWLRCSPPQTNQPMRFVSLILDDGQHHVTKLS